MAERLYGVTELGIIDGPFGLYTLYLPVNPSPEFRQELLSLPKGTIVGVATTPEIMERKLPATVEGQTLTFPDEQEVYWRSIVVFCQSAGHTVVFLEDLEVLTEHFKRKAEAANIRDALKTIPHSSENEPKAFPLIAAHYKAEIEAEYLLKIRRGQVMAEKARQAGVQVAIVPTGISESFIQSGCFDSNGNPPKYQRELIEIDPLVAEPAAVARLMPETPPNPEFLLQQKLLERKLKMVREGRVTDETPDFIGTWDVRCPAKGLFEIRITKRDDENFEAVISDRAGTSVTTEGIITDDYVWFVKNYVPGESMIADKEPMKYQGESSNGVDYTGHWTNSKRSGNFTMRIFDSSNAARP